MHENSFKDGEFTFGFGSASKELYANQCWFNLTKLCTNDTDVKVFVNGEDE